MIEKIITGSFVTNTYIISNNDKCVIVDPGLDFEQYVNEIITKYKVEAILLTHGHMDHIDGIRFFKGVPIYIHKLDEEFLTNPSLSLYKFMGMKSLINKNDYIINLVNDKDILNLIGYEFKVIHTPGHTRGSVCYQYKNKLLSGDTLFKMSAGRTDFPTGNMLDLRLSLQKLMSICSPNMDVYPGHEDKTTIKNEKNHNPFI